MLQNSLQYMTKKKGDISNRGLKLEIIKLILKNNGPIEEPIIRKGLKTDQGNLNRHSRQLEKFCCIQFVETIKKDSRKLNRWDIIKIENLLKIKEKFPELQLNTFEKATSIVFKKAFPKIDPRNEKKYFVQLVLSNSFFDKCIETNIEILYTRVSKRYQSIKDFNNEIEKMTNKVYTTYIITRNIVAKPDLLRVINDMYINKSLDLDAHQNFPKFFSGIEISEDKFKKILEGIQFPWVSEEELKKRIEEIHSLLRNDSWERETEIIVKELSKKMAHELLSKTFKEISVESLKIPNEALNKILKNLGDKIYEEIFEKLMEPRMKYCRDDIYSIVYTQYMRDEIIFNQIFDIFHNRDVIDDTVSSEAIDFIDKMNYFNSIYSSDPNTARSGLDKLYKDYYEKCKRK